ncbi:MAG: hypothetical protein P9M07_04865 [Candidatus Aceula meridiana]|nr:hypothetical protein [Candidatus Aceula meridiana]
MLLSYISIFYVSSLALSFELFATQVLNLKTWNHVVYIVIPFAILGYGIGANAYILNKEKLAGKKHVVPICLALASVLTFLSMVTLIYFPTQISYLVDLFKNLHGIFMLLLSYSILAVPFVVIGFLISYIFHTNPKKNFIIYFFDLAGASLGTVLFYPLINSLAIVHSVALLCFIGLCLSFLWIAKRNAKYKILFAILTIVFLVGFIKIPEVQNYKIDEAKGWEYLPGTFSEGQYKNLYSKWTPLGRVDVVRVEGKENQKKIRKFNRKTFQINVTPAPDLAYISNNFLAGTVVYKLSSEGLAEKNSQLKVFSLDSEACYVGLRQPKVLIIGTGGGRDIFIAKSHDAHAVAGAEINPGIFRAMSEGGPLYEYSGKVYGLEGVKIYPVDGRHFVKRFKDGDFDLLIVNLVDTFSGLSTGAYTYSESYLYTKEAILDYLSVLKDDGRISFCRCWTGYPPRESLRLYAIALDALKTMGAQRPWEHIIIGGGESWQMLIKKTPFLKDEREQIIKYLRNKNELFIFPSNIEYPMPIIFDSYLAAFRQGEREAFEKRYPFDVSVVTDNDPFFYKHYKISSFNPFNVIREHHLGTVMFLTQILVLLQALIFIFLFIFLPLFLSKKTGIKAIPRCKKVSFIAYFATLGLGFMFVEIPLMQKFVLLLGSPIYSISITLAAILFSSGLGSLLASFLEKSLKSKVFLHRSFFFMLAAFLLLLIFGAGKVVDLLINYSFAVRALGACLLIFPVGLTLGFFFPAGLQFLSKDFPDAIPWAWGINSGFSVLGSILAITVAQFLGFNFVLSLALILYFLNTLFFGMFLKK